MPLGKCSGNSEPKDTLSLEAQADALLAQDRKARQNWREDEYPILTAEQLEYRREREVACDPGIIDRADAVKLAGEFFDDGRPTAAKAVQRRSKARQQRVKKRSI